MLLQHGDGDACLCAWLSLRNRRSGRKLLSNGFEEFDIDQRFMLARAWNKRSGNENSYALDQRK